MKKARLLTLVILIMTLGLILLVGCGKKDNISSISLGGHDPEDVIETAVGEFDYSAYKLVVRYESGSTEELALTEDMISEADLFKLYQVGEHDITVSYSDHTYTFKVLVKRSSFDNVRFPEESVFTYDGSAHTVEVEGDIPAGATVTYPGGNSFVNAGVYDVTAIVTCEGYVTARLSTTVTVERAKYDMSGVWFDGAEFVYDGRPHSITVKGTLPEGVSGPTYTVDGKNVTGAVDVGEYKVKASFTGNNPNYDEIPDMVATLKITPAVYDLGDVDILFKNGRGEQLDERIKIYDGEDVSFEISDKSPLGSKIYVSYTLTDSEGNEKDRINEAGVYSVTMNVSLIDGKNYQPIPSVTRTFVVKKATYDTSGIYFDANLAIYDGEAHKILVVLPDGHDIKPEDITYEYRLGDELLTVDPDVGVTDAGVYTVTAKFAVRNENYEAIPDRQVTLKIEKQEIDVSVLGFVQKGNREYTGEEYSPEFVTWQDANIKDHDVLHYSAFKFYKLNQSGVYEETNVTPRDAGRYRCTVTVTVAPEFSRNFALPEGQTSITYTYNFEIYTVELDTPLVGFDDTPLTFSSEDQTVDFEIISDVYTMTYEVKYYRYSGGEYVSMDGALPRDAGSYRCLITFTVKNPTNYSFSAGTTSAEVYYDFEIAKMVIDVESLYLVGKDQYSIGWDWREVRAEGLDAVADYVTYYPIELYRQYPGEAGVTRVDEAYEPGRYQCYMAVSVKEVNNVVFSDGSRFVALTHWFDAV